jgi:hypothetical protein
MQDNINQTELSLSWSGEVEAAFGDGRLYIEVDDEKRHSPHLSFIDRAAKWDGIGAIVHVISRPAGGEIRGYVLIAGKLHLRLPCYSGPCAEMDAAVARRVLGAAAAESFADGASEPFCACGRRVSQCDRSRTGCNARQAAKP